MKDDLSNLDLLRSVAVLLVLACHTVTAWDVYFVGPFAVGYLGSLGVSLFFVHTCCVLMRSLDRQQPDALFTRFMIRRIFRIYPLAMTAVCVALAVHLTPQTGPLSPAGVAANLLLVQTVSHTPSLPPPLWSLPLELQMYLFLPAIYIGMKRFGSFPVLLIGWLCSIPLAVSQLHETGGFFYLLRFLPCFLPGVMAWWSFRTAKPTVSPIVFGAVLGGSMVLLMLFASPPVEWFIALQLGLLLPTFRQIASPVIRRVCRIIARYSYGIYLSHAIALTLFFRREAPFATIALAYVTIAIVSVLVYHLIEQPCIRLGGRIANRIQAGRATVVVAELPSVAAELSS